MTPDDALKTADQALFSSTGKRLTTVQRLILQESMADKNYEAMEGYSPQHIKNEGKILWDLLSNALGEGVSKKNFKGALEKRWKAGNVVPSPPMLSIYSPQTWVGRTAVIDELLPKLQGQTRLLWITGLSGIGKTTLGECLARYAWELNPSFQWIYLEILEGQSLEFVSVATDLLAKLGGKDLDLQERNDPDRLIERLLRQLQANHYWIQMDSLERLLNSKPLTETEFTDPHWITFFQRCLIEPHITSQIVLTAQALPNTLLGWRDRYPNTFQDITLTGLSAHEKDSRNEHLKLFTQNGVTVDETSSNHLRRIGQIYEGHPLVLQVIAKEVLSSPFNGNVVTYWQRYGKEFEQVVRDLQTEQVSPALYNQALRRQVSRRVEISLKRLPSNALDLLCRSSVYRRPVPETFWLAMIEDITPTQQQVAYRVLGDRALVERTGIHQGQFLIRQHNLIRSVAYTLLKADPPTWKTAEDQAAHLWLTAYKPAPNAPNLETVRGYLEAFDHYAQIGLLEKAGIILETSVDSLNKTWLQHQLYNWRCFQELMRLYNLLLGKSSFLTREANWYSGLGLVHHELGHYLEAARCHEVVREIAESLSDKKAEAEALGNWALAQLALGNHQLAISACEKQLAFARETCDKNQEIGALITLGNTCKDTTDNFKALSFYQKSYEISVQNNNSLGEAISLSSIGSVQILLEKYRQDGKKNLETALKLFTEIESSFNRAKTLAKLAELHQALGEVEVARQYGQQALALATELGISLKAECEALLSELEKGDGE